MKSYRLLRIQDYIFRIDKTSLNIIPMRNYFYLLLFTLMIVNSNAQDTVRVIIASHEILKIDNKTLHLSSQGKGTFIGANAGSATPNTDNWNTFVGYESGKQTSFGISNAYFGAFSGSANTNGSGNTFLGSFAGRDNTGSSNTFVGSAAGRLSGAGFNNNFIGINAGSQNSGGYNISIGNFAGQYGNGRNNIAIGRNSLPNTFSKDELIAIGDSTLFSNGQGSNFFFQAIQNTAIGTKALKKNTIGSKNTATGYEALENNTNGSNNASFGATALTNNIDGFGNTAVGAVALFNNLSGDFNTALGYDVGRNTLGNENTYIGSKAGTNNGNGSGNVFLGYSAGENSIGGNQLMIHNSNTATPLLHGFFDSSKLVINGDLNVTGTLNLPSIHVSQLDGILGDGYSEVIPDVAYNMATLEVAGIFAPTEVLIVSTIGFEIDTFSTPGSNGIRIPEAGLNSEFPVIFETDDLTVINAMDNWIAGPPGNRRSISLIIEDITDQEIARYNFFEYLVDSKEPGTDGRTRYTIRHDLPPGGASAIEIVDDFFESMQSYDPATDKLVDVARVNGPFFTPEVTIDYNNRVLIFEYGYKEGNGFFAWVEDIADGIVDRRSLSIIETTDGTPSTEISRRNFFEVIPFKYEVVYGFGLNTKIKARVHLTYAIWEDL